MSLVLHAVLSVSPTYPLIAPNLAQHMSALSFPLFSAAHANRQTGCTPLTAVTCADGLTCVSGADGYTCNGKSLVKLSSIVHLTNVVSV